MYDFWSHFVVRLKSDSELSSSSRAEIRKLKLRSKKVLRYLPLNFVWSNLENFFLSKNIESRTRAIFYQDIFGRHETQSNDNGRNDTLPNGCLWFNHCSSKLRSICAVLLTAIITNVVQKSVNLQNVEAPYLTIASLKGLSIELFRAKKS
jgi:hypothetical protein